MRVYALPGSSPWSYALRGVIALLFGGTMLVMPGIGLLSFVFAYGLFSLFDGIVATVASFFGVRGKRIDWGLLLVGLVSLAVGLFFLFRPGLSIAALSLVIAAWLVAVGLGTLLSAIGLRKQISGEWLLGLAGVLTIAFGIFLFARPIVALALLPLFLGGYALLWGILLLAAAFRLWRHRDRTGGAALTPRAA